MTTKMQERKRKWSSWRAHDDENASEGKKTVAKERS